MIKALILDLDNTIYPVTSIGNELFEPLLNLLDAQKQKIGEDVLKEIKKQIMKRAWQKVADEVGLDPDLVQQGTDLLRDLDYDKPMQTFADYKHLKAINLPKVLVTMGFTKMQQSKVKQLNISADFEEILINDPDLTKNTKKEVFQDLMLKYSLRAGEILVIGDDPKSEIDAALQLGIPAVLYDRGNEFSNDDADHRINNYADLQRIIDSYNQ